LDPFAKIPEFKFCAVKLTSGDRLQDRISRKKQTETNQEFATHH